MSEPRRVVITGIGAITPIGMGVDGLWGGLRRRSSAVRCITRFDPTMFKSRIAGEVPDFVPTDHIEERRARRLDRYSQFAIAATRMPRTPRPVARGRQLSEESQRHTLIGCQEAVHSANTPPQGGVLAQS